MTAQVKKINNLAGLSDLSGLTPSRFSLSGLAAGLPVQMFKFISVGVLNTLIDAGIYFALTRWTAFFAAQLVLAKSISYAVGIVNSFFWNRTWTFQSRSNAWRTGALFTATHIVALVINAGVMAICLESLNMPEVAAVATATGAAFVWNFGLNKFVVFKS